MMLRLVFAAVVLFTVRAARAETCPGADDEPAMKVKTSAGPVLVVCGFEDREEKAQGRNIFTDFTVYAWPSGVKEPAKVFAADPSDTFWIKEVKDKGLTLEEVWSFDEKPQAALVREVTCTPVACEVTPAKCVLKLKKNRFPKAVATLHAGNFGEKGDELLEQAWAQALTGEKTAQDYFEGEPKGLAPDLVEEFKVSKAKLQQAKDLKCPSLTAK